MAWIRWRKTKDGRRLASVQWRDEHGRVRSKATKTSDPRLIEMHVRQASRLEGKGSPTRIRSEDGLELLEEFLEEKALSVRPATLDVYRGKLQPLFACWAGTRPGEWTRAMFVQYAKARKWGPRTLEMAVGCCRRFIAWAHEQDIPVGDFIGSFKGPPVRTREHSPLTPKQIAKLLEVARGHALEVPIALAALAGLSQADLYSIEWSDVDLDDGVIHRRREKTGVELRIPITRTLEEILQRNRAISGLVCRRLPNTQGSARHSLQILTKKAGIPKAPRGQNGWHRFRHSLGTDLGRASDVSTVGRVLGHARGSTITLRYMHSDDERVREVLQARDAEIQESAN